MTYSAGAVERAMTIHQALLHALHGRQTWLQVADVIGLSPRSVRRWRARLEQFGVPGLLDRRRQTPSLRRVPLAELQRVLRLYRERYQGFNVRHFHQLAQRDHGVTFSYTLVKTALQGAGLVRKGRARGRHRRRREPRPCFGELLHLDGSRHRWLALTPDAWHTLLVVVDDATKQVLYAQLVDGGESHRARSCGRSGPCSRATGCPARSTRTAPTGPSTPRPRAVRPIGRAHADRPRAAGARHRTHSRPLPAGPRAKRAREPHAPRPPRQRTPPGRDPDRPGGQSLPRRALPPDLSTQTFGRPPGRSGRARSWPSPRRNSSRPSVTRKRAMVARDNTVTLDRVVLQIAQAAWPPHLCRTAGPRAPPSRWPSLRLVGAPLPGPLRPPPAGPSPSGPPRLPPDPCQPTGHFTCQNPSGQITCQQQPSAAPAASAPPPWT